jgi:hypothetical protein
MLLKDPKERIDAASIIEELTITKPNDSLLKFIKNSLDEFSFLFQDTGLRVDILKGDIIDQIANVIVNPANNALQLSCLFLISLNLYIISLILKLDLERLFYQRLEMKFK